MSHFAHLAFAPYREWLQNDRDLYDPDYLNREAMRLGCTHAFSGKPIRFSTEAKPATAAEYEQGIATTGLVPTRADNLHDALNALVWLRFPRFKSAINHAHCNAFASSEQELVQRGRRRDHLTLLDESGILVASRRGELLEMLETRRWAALFWDARAQVVQHMRFIVVGHGLLEKCLHPFPEMTGKCLFLELDELDGFCEQDVAAAQAVATLGHRTLPPLPLLGIPGWGDNDRRETYLDTRVFRPARTA